MDLSKNLFYKGKLVNHHHYLIIIIINNKIIQLLVTLPLKEDDKNLMKMT